MDSPEEMLLKHAEFVPACLWCQLVAVICCMLRHVPSTERPLAPGSPTAASAAAVGLAAAAEAALLRAACCGSPALSCLHRQSSSDVCRVIANAFSVFSRAMLCMLLVKVPSWLGSPATGQPAHSACVISDPRATSGVPHPYILERMTYCDPDAAGTSPAWQRSFRPACCTC
jgi:hypothetical protein